MHDIQRKILSLANADTLIIGSYRKMAEQLGVEHAAQARHHYLKLLQDGSLVYDETGRLRPVGKTDAPLVGLLSIPVMGEVDCGTASRLALDRVQGYLTVSPNALSAKNVKGIYALKACGSSMNAANIGGGSKSIEESDYVIVRNCEPGEVRDGDYIVSLINGMANAKRFRRDRAQNNRIVLMSESIEDFPPIIIDEEDDQYYQPVGKIVDVVKGVNHLA